MVFFVAQKSHSYIQNAEEREEAGTPDTVGCIRAGLVYHIHTMLPVTAMDREQVGLEYLLQRWSKHPRIDLLGPSKLGSTPRSAIISFMIRYGNDDAGGGLYLHYNYVVAVLNDLFGVQARGGCACAGPYGQVLLGIDESLASKFDECLARSAHEVLRPGFVRVGVHFTLSKQELETLATAVEWVADKAWRLLPAYTFDADTGEWNHRHESNQLDRVWLSAVVPPVMRASPLRALEESIAPKAAPPPEDLLATADDALISSFRGEGAVVSLTSTRCPMLDAEYASLLWFATPSDAAASLRAGSNVPVLSEDGAIFAGAAAESGNAERVSSSIFSVRQWKSKTEMEEEESSTKAPATPEDNEAAGADDADWEPFMGEWGEADDSETVTNPNRLKYPLCSLEPKVHRDLRHQVGRAISEFGMIKEGDKLLIGLSGGKDSLCMLHILLEMQKRSAINFTIACATVNPETPEYNPTPLIEYMEALGVKYHFLCKPIIDIAKKHLDPKKPSLCAFCARMKRGMLYSCMREHGYTVLCLGQHLDDFAESLLMSAFHNGSLRTMKANYFVEAHDLRVARPLVYVRERVMAQFAKENQLPIIQDNCPACFAAPKERHRIKLVLSEQEFVHPDLFWSLLKCMKPLISIKNTERTLRGTGILGKDEPDEDEDAATGALEEVLAKVKPAAAVGCGATADASACPVAFSDGAMGLGSDDCDVAEAALVGAGVDLAAAQVAKGLGTEKSSPVSRSWDLPIQVWAPMLLVAMAPMIFMSQRRSR